MVLRSIAFNAEYQLEHFQSICNHYLEELDGTKVPVFLMPADPAVTRRALAEGIITLKDVEKARKYEQKMRKLEQGIRYTSDYSDWNFVCSNLAVLRGSGRNAGNDFWKDYEQPKDTVVGYCVTAFFYTWAKAKGGQRPSSFLVKPYFGDSLFRRRVIIGMSGMPDYFAHAQAALILK